MKGLANSARRGFTIESQGHVYVAGGGLDEEHELIQETFVRAFADKARASYDGLRPYRPFLLRITKNLMIDRYRARRRQRLREGGRGVGDIDDILETNAAFAVVATPADDLHWNALSAATSEFWQKLDRESRDVVRWRFQEELSQDATAARLGCSRRRVRTLENRLVKRLRRHLKKLGVLDGWQKS